MNILIDIIKYFAKFPDRTGVLEIFAKSKDLMTGYEDLKNYITALPDPLVPDIKDFLVSTREQVISEKIRTISGYFMMVEYAGMISDPPNQAYIRESAMNLSVIIAHPGNMRNIDLAEEALIMDKALDLAGQVAKRMDLDNREICANRRYMPGGISLSPVDPLMLYGCIGWSLTFTKNEPFFNA